MVIIEAELHGQHFTSDVKSSHTVNSSTSHIAYTEPSLYLEIFKYSGFVCTHYKMYICHVRSRGVKVIRKCESSLRHVYRRPVALVSAAVITGNDDNIAITARMLVGSSDVICCSLVAEASHLAMYGQTG